MEWLLYYYKLKTYNKKNKDLNKVFRMDKISWLVIFFLLIIHNHYPMFVFYLTYGISFVIVKDIINYLSTYYSTKKIYYVYIFILPICYYLEIIIPCVLFSSFLIIENIINYINIIYFNTLEYTSEDNNCKLTRGSYGAAGLDIKSKDDYIIKPGSQVMVSTGIKIKIPSGYYCQISDRSSLSLKGIKVLGGVIDSDYRGEIKVLLFNLGSYEYVINKYDKIAQLICINILTPELKLTKELDITERNQKGFGSTGK